jgi:hypothetical protein
VSGSLGPDDYPVQVAALGVAGHPASVSYHPAGLRGDWLLRQGLRHADSGAVDIGLGYCNRLCHSLYPALPAIIGGRGRFGGLGLGPSLRRTGTGHHQERINRGAGICTHVPDIAHTLHNRGHIHGINHGPELGGIPSPAAVDHLIVRQSGD